LPSLEEKEKKRGKKPGRKLPYGVLITEITAFVKMQFSCK
jgi:hypothetical protein